MAYGEVGQAEFIRDNTGAITGIRFQGRTWSPSSVAAGGVVEAASLAAFPATGDVNFLYAALDTKKLYLWTGSVYAEASGLPASTDVVPEGSTNLYSTAARILGQALAGIDVVTRGAVDATKTVLQAIGLLEASKQDKLKNQTLVTNTTYTVIDTDAGKELVISNAAGCTITIPVGLPAKFRCDWLTTSAVAGTVLFQGDGTSQVLSTNNVYTATGPKCAGQISYTGTTNQYLLSGQLGSIVSTDISDFVEATQDVIGAMVQAAGGGYNDPAGTISFPSGSRPAFFESGTFWNIPQVGANGTNTGGGHSGNFTILGAAVAASGVLNGMGFQRRQVITSSVGVSSGAGVRSSSTGVAFMPGTSNAEVMRGEFIQGCADSLTDCHGAMGYGWFGGSAPNMATAPDQFTNAIMLAFLQGDTQWSLMHNDNAGTCTIVQLNGGTGFPCNGLNTDYIRFYCAANGGSSRTVDWRVVNLITGLSVSGQITTNMPVADTQLMVFNYRATSSTNSTVAAAINYGGCFGGAAVGAA